jgi:hypothetical protein
MLVRIRNGSYRPKADIYAALADERCLRVQASVVYWRVRKTTCYMFDLSQMFLPVFNL